MNVPRPREEDGGHGGEQSPRQQRWRRLAQPLAGVVIALVSVYSLGRATDLQDSLVLIRSTHVPALVLAVVLLVASLAAKSFRWRTLLPAPHAVGRGEAYRVFHVSILLNNLLPFRVGDGMRILSPPIRRSVPAGQALMVLVAERLIDLITLLGVALVAAPAISRLLPTPNIPNPDRVALLVTGAVALLIGAGLMAVIRAFGFTTRTPAGIALASRLLSLYRDIRVVTSPDRARVARMAGWTVVAWAGTLLLHYLLFGALGVSGSLALAVAVTLSTNLSMLLPAAPANIGIFHAAAAAPLMASGVSADHSVAYAVLAHGVNTLPPIVIGLVCLALTRDLLPGFARPRA